MAAASLVVVVLVGLADADSAATHTMGATAEQVLGGDAIVLVRGVESPPLDTDAESMETTLHADALAEVTWPSNLHAHVHLHSGSPETWSDRDIDFTPADDPMERGRALGLVIASMVHVPPKKETTSTTNEPKNATPIVVPVAPPTAKGEPSRFAMDVVIAASRGIGGYAGGVGGELGVRVRLARSIDVRSGVSARLGEVPPAGASAAAYRVDAGLAWSFVSVGDERPLVFGVRTDALLLRHALARPTPDDRGVSRDARWLGGADAMFETAWSFVPDAAIVGAAGVELAFGTTRVFNEGDEVAVIPRLRLLFELGLRARF